MKQKRRSAEGCDLQIDVRGGRILYSILSYVIVYLQIDVRGGRREFDLKAREHLSRTYDKTYNKIYLKAREHLSRTYNKTYNKIYLKAREHLSGRAAHIFL